MRFLFVALVLVGAGYFIISGVLKEQLPSPALPQLNKKIAPDLETIEIDDKIYRYALAEVSRPNQLILYPNFEEQMTTPTIIGEKNCSLLVNGGFYGEDDLPIGWLVAQGTQKSEKVRSDLLNGFLAIMADGEAVIESQIPEGQVGNGIQSGPLLIRGGEPQRLSIRNDESKRRVAAATSGGKLYFLAVVGKDSNYEGPRLENLPDIVEAIGISENLSFDSAINLDGGSASAFYNDGVELRELTHIGSYFCMP